MSDIAGRFTRDELRAGVVVSDNVRPARRQSPPKWLPFDAQPHRLTLAQWSGFQPDDTPGSPPFAVYPEQRCTAACDCGWHLTARGADPGQVLDGYAEHLTAGDATDA